MSTSLSDLPLPPGQQELAGQQQFDLNSMIDVASSQATQQHQEEPNLSAGALQYQMDASQIPYHGPNPNLQIQEEPQYMDGPSQYEMMMQQQMEPEELTLVQKLTNEIKLPIIVAVLFLLFSLPQVNKLITKFVPRLLSENGEMNMMGIAGKAVIVAILVTLIKLFV
jgi:hypothetical protein